MNLNIIGNGFDLYHGLPSSYYYFGCYIIERFPEYYEKFAQMYHIKWMKPIGSSIAHDYTYIVENMFWREFESHLGEVDESFIIDTYTVDLGLEFDDPIDIEMDDYEIAERLKRKFVYWVRDTLDKEGNYNIIKENMNNIFNEEMFNKSDYFIQFNYTHTLQELYEISNDKIYYVHGECFGEEDDELIIGHGNINRIDEIKKCIDELEENYNYTQQMNNNINEYNCLLKYVETLKKDVEKHRSECNNFYEKIIGNIDYINIYGLSLGDVDIPYLQQIRLKWPNAKWKFSYYTTNDKTRCVYVASDILNLSEDEYETFYFLNSQSNTIKMEIIEKLDIIEY